MARTVADIGMPEENWPPAGKEDCRCYGTETWISPKKKTPAVKLHWVSLHGLYDFTDLVFVTPKALSRLSLVAQRVCGISKDTELPDENAAAAKFLGRYILENAKDKCATVTIEEQLEEFIYENGPNVGQKGSKTRHKVAFSGYEVLTDEDDADLGKEITGEPGPDIPF
ncbi:MAG TPA: hypothetical protein VM223_26955 [Planctomycetota bacterium]|nr:hypothetical protein [Planctomycetota bacterium]